MVGGERLVVAMDLIGVGVLEIGDGALEEVEDRHDGRVREWWR